MTNVDKFFSVIYLHVCMDYGAGINGGVSFVFYTKVLVSHFHFMYIYVVSL